ncbi:WD repeat-containing protein 25 [Asparagus officinalis]|nr:WD repeat-containing protein 25 [Asparagus officinalis]
MDLLCSAYAAAASDDDDDDDETDQSKELLSPPPPPKRARSSSSPSERFYSYHPKIGDQSYSRLSRPPPLSTEEAKGRYVSKRERAMLSCPSSSSPSSSSSSRVSDAPAPYPQAHTVSTTPVVGSIAVSDLPSDILSLLRSRTTVHANKVAGRSAILLSGHTGAVNSIEWSQSHAHLLASSGMDQTVHVWNIWSKDQKKARIFRYHNAAIKDVRWSMQGLSLLSCGYDCASRLVDVEKGAETQLFKEDQVVETIRFHPSDSSLFLSGGSKGILRLWDVRCSKVVHEYVKGLGSILDIEFSNDGKHFIASTDTSRSRISENSIIVWDVAREVPLSNQVYGEAYTCPCVRYHPTNACFVAQSNANYIAIFSSRPPFKLDRYKRYEGHGVWGYPIKCNFSSDGKELASGSSDGCIYFYDYKSSRFLRKIKAFEEACVDVAFHPLIPNVIASCSWTGEISVFQ